MQRRRVQVPRLQPLSLDSSDSAAKIAELEKGFWVCDYIGTTRGVEGPHSVACGANFEELKQAKFGGDFDALVSGGASTRPRNTQRWSRPYPRSSEHSNHRCIPLM